MPQEKVSILVSLKDNAAKGIKSLKTNLTKFGKATDRAKVSIINFGNRVGKLKGPILALGAVIGAVSIGFLKAAGSMETWTISFSTMLKSEKKAKELLKDITDFASKTPFELPGLIESAKQLLAFGTGVDEIIPLLTNMGNIAAGVGKDKLPTLIRAYGKIRVKGKASMEELNMMLEAGVPILDELAIGFGVTTQEVLKMSRLGKIGSEDVTKALQRLSTGTGIFAGLMVRLSRSMGGMFSNLKDNVYTLSMAIGKRLIPAAKALLKVLGKITDTELLFNKLPKTIEKDWVNLKVSLAIIAAQIEEIITRPFRLERYLGIFDKLKNGVIKGYESLSKDIKKTSDEMEVIYKERLEKEEKEEVSFTEKIKNIREQQVKDLRAIDNKYKPTSSSTTETKKTVSEVDTSLAKDALKDLENEYKAHTDTKKELNSESLENEIRYWESIKKEAALSHAEIAQIDTRLSQLRKSRLDELLTGNQKTSASVVIIAKDERNARIKYLKDILKEEKLNNEQRQKLESEIKQLQLNNIDEIRKKVTDYVDFFTDDVTNGILAGNLSAEESFERLGKKIEKELIKGALTSLIKKLFETIGASKKLSESMNNVGGGEKDKNIFEKITDVLKGGSKKEGGKLFKDLLSLSPNILMMKLLGDATAKDIEAKTKPPKGPPKIDTRGAEQEQIDRHTDHGAPTNFLGSIMGGGKKIMRLATGGIIGDEKRFTDTPIQSFEPGGVVGGTSYSGDKIPALMNSGEAVLTQEHQRTMVATQQAIFNFFTSGQIEKQISASIKQGFDNYGGNGSSVNSSEIASAVASAMSAAPININIDGREVAQATIQYHDEYKAAYDTGRI